MEGDEPQEVKTEQSVRDKSLQQSSSRAGRGTQNKWYTPLTRATKLAKYLAMALFVVLPFVGFWVGVEYIEQRVVFTNVSSDKLNTEEEPLTSEQGQFDYGPSDFVRYVHDAYVYTEPEERSPNLRRYGLHDTFWSGLCSYDLEFARNVAEQSIQGIRRSDGLISEGEIVRVEEYEEYYEFLPDKRFSNDFRPYKIRIHKCTYFNPGTTTPWRITNQVLEGETMEVYLGIYNRKPMNLKSIRSFFDTIVPRINDGKFVRVLNWSATSSIQEQLDEYRAENSGGTVINSFCGTDVEVEKFWTVYLRVQKESGELYAGVHLNKQVERKIEVIPCRPTLMPTGF